MLFAATVDTGLVPFFVFTALVSNSERRIRLTDPANAKWRSVFHTEVAPENDATSKVIQSILLFGIVNGALHLVSLLLSLYLAVIFRKIAQLPPDMNPLESNLTSRHKKKNSSISEKRMSKATTHSSFAGPTDSARSSVIYSSPPRTIPFMHTRNQSNSPTTTAINSARTSRADLPSQLANGRPSSSLSRSVRSAPPKRKSAFIESASLYGTEFDQENTPPKRNSKNALLSDNWYVHVPIQDEGEEEDIGMATMMGDRDISGVSSLTPADYEYAQRAEAEELGYTPLPQPYEEEVAMVPHPLGMNPPTPTPEEGIERSETVIRHHQPRPTKEIKAPKSDGLSPGSANRTVTAGPKAKFYGDLRAATPPVMGTYVDHARDDDDDRQPDSVRVVSSGAQWGLNIGGKGKVRGRDVSGKIAEEGRGGWVRGKRGWQKG